MKPKILLAVLAVAGLVLGSAYLFKLPLPAPVTETGPVQKMADTNPPVTNEVAVQKPVEPVTNPAPEKAAAPTNSAPTYASLAEHEAAINAERGRLASWSMRSDPQSLSNILADLNSPDQEIRMAAIEAAKQFEDTNAIPVLRDAASKATDPNEAVAMLRAIQWLNTPSIDFSSAGSASQANANLTPAQAQAQAADKAKAVARIQAAQQNKAGKVNGPNSAGSGQSTGQNNNQSQPTPGQNTPPGPTTGPQ
jgi:hypothetical protein